MRHLIGRADTVGRILLGMALRETQIGLIWGVNAVEQVTGMHRLTEAFHQLQPRARHLRSAGQARNACDSQVINRDDDAVPLGPTGMSKTRWVDPAAIFLDRIEATI